MESYPLPIFIQTLAITTPKLNIYVPQLQFLNDAGIQYHINQTISHRVQYLFQLVKSQGYYQAGKTTYLGDYEIKNNQRGIVSLTLSNFATMQSMAHPVDHLTSLTIDVRTGKFYTLKDLFKPNSSYVERLSELIKIQLKQRNLSLFNEIKSIRPDQDYYVADKSLVIYFQRYEIGPRPLGYPMFPISIYSIEDIIDENGPLGIMKKSQ